MSPALDSGVHFTDDELEIVLFLVMSGPLDVGHFDQASESFVSLLKLGVVEHEGNLVSFNLERYLVVSNSNWDPSI